ncbi:glycosyl transferase family 2 [Silicimonas algicola]|uniref:Glycosyl transferase family 2 n=2 Tax=Silicimonas algicola TaxID=1826607 RepID=A0A316GE38_9RHOB|nr:glycosyl transferase family 2 [Silicimonas algicola]
MIIPAHNEAGVIRRKLENSLVLAPAPDEVIVVNDGSDDATLAVAREFESASHLVRVIDRQPRGGKAAAMNAGVEAASYQTLLFSDCSEIYERNAIGELIGEFSDPSVAVVSGSHRLTEPDFTSEGAMTGRSEGLYWRYEDYIRSMESRLGATVASVGSMLAVRRTDWQPLAKGIVNDDAWITMSNLSRGRNVRFASHAIGWEAPSESTAVERTRRIRITAGRIFLLTRREIWPFRRPFILAAFLSHKVMRIFLPLPMLLGAIANLAVVWMAPDRTFFAVLLFLHGAAASLALAGLVAERLGRKWRLAHLAYHLVASNAVMLLALVQVVLGRNFTFWKKASR